MVCRPVRLRLARARLRAERVDIERVGIEGPLALGRAVGGREGVQLCVDRVEVLLRWGVGELGVFGQGGGCVVGQLGVHSGVPRGQGRQLSEVGVGVYFVSR